MQSPNLSVVIISHTPDPDVRERSPDTSTERQMPVGQRRSRSPILHSRQVEKINKQEVARHIEEIYSNCETAFRDRVFSRVNDEIGRLNYGLERISEAEKKYQLNQDLKDKLIKMVRIKRVLPFINKYYLNENGVVRFEYVCHPNSWKVYLQSRYEDSDFDDYHKAIQFVEYYLLSDFWHSEHDAYQRRDRYLLAYHFLIWAVSSRKLSKDDSFQCVRNIISTCQKLNEFNLTSIGKEDVVSIVDINKLQDQICNEKNISDAFPYLHTQYLCVVSNDYDFGELLKLACASAVFYNKWVKSRTLIQGVEIYKKHSEIIYYSSLLLVFGLRNIRSRIGKGGEMSYLLKELEYLPAVIFKNPYCKPVQELVYDLLTVKDAVSHEDWFSIYKQFKGQCGVLLNWNWLYAAGALGKGDYERAFGHIDSSHADATARAESDECCIVELLFAKYLARQGKEGQALQVLRGINIPSQSILRIQEADILRAAGDKESAVKILKEELSLANELDKGMYEYMIKEIKSDTFEPYIPEQETVTPESMTQYHAAVVKKTGGYDKSTQTDAGVLEMLGLQMSDKNSSKSDYSKAMMELEGVAEDLRQELNLIRQCLVTERKLNVELLQGKGDFEHQCQIKINQAEQSLKEISKERDEMVKELKDHVIRSGKKEDGLLKTN